MGMKSSVSRRSSEHEDDTFSRLSPFKSLRSLFCKTSLHAEVLRRPDMRNGGSDRLGDTARSAKLIINNLLFEINYDIFTLLYGALTSK